jgi:hypothetical protein
MPVAFAETTTSHTALREPPHSTSLQGTLAAIPKGYKEQNRTSAVC